MEVLNWSWTRLVLDGPDPYLFIGFWTMVIFGPVAAIAIGLLIASRNGQPWWVGVLSGLAFAAFVIAIFVLVALPN